MTKKSTGHKATKSPSMNSRARKSKKSAGSTQGKSRQDKSQKPLMSGGNLTRGGCLPKLVILILPFIGVGAFLFTRF